jgi:hypothetical protein
VALDYFNTQRERALIDKGSNALYRFIRSKLGSQPDVPPLADQSGQVRFSDQEKCDLLAQHFMKSFTDATDSQFPLDSPSPPNTLSDLDVSPVKILKLLTALPPRNSTSPDGIPYIVLKNPSLNLTL